MSGQHSPTIDVSKRIRQSGRQLRHWFSDRTGTAVAVVIIVAIWEGVTQLYIQNDAYLPSASFTVQQSIDNVDLLIDGIITTFSAVLMAFPIAVILGVIIGIIFAESFYARQSSMPILVFSYAIPHAILAPMFLIWFGLGLRGVTAFAIWIAFFPTFINTLTSMSTVDPEMQKLADITGATRWQRVRYLKFFKALPDIISGVRISIQMTIVGVIVAEFLAGGAGLGRLIERATFTGRLGLTFGAVITIGVGAIIVFKVITCVLRWIDPSERGDGSMDN